MAVVGQEEQERRGRAAGGTLFVLILALFLGAPFIGWIAAFFAAIWMAGKAYKKSATPILDVSLALGVLIPYYLVVWATMGNIANGIVGMWFAVSLYSLGWIWLLHARAQVASD